MRCLASRSASRRQSINCHLQVQVQSISWLLLIVVVSSSSNIGQKKSYEVFIMEVSKPPSIHQLSSGLPSSSSSSSSYCCIEISSQALKLWNYDTSSIFIMIRLGVREVFSIAVFNPSEGGLQPSGFSCQSHLKFNFNFKMDLVKFVLLFCYNQKRVTK